MQNLSIARVLEEVADLLELRGSNPFRIRAYRNAARTVGAATRPLAAMVAEGEDLTGLPGVGKDISSHITELVETGQLGLLEELRGEMPSTLVDLLRLEGVGPKKARTLYDDLKIASVPELEAALDTGAIEKLAGFGARTVEKLRRSVSDFHKHTGRMLLSEADRLVQPLLEHLRRCDGVERISVAGSYRRRKETVGDIDLLAACEEPDPVMERLVTYAGAERVVGSGQTKGTVVLWGGLQVDLRVVPARSYGAALHYFTGSKEHNVVIRQRGMKRGLKVNEYGVFRMSRTGAQAQAGAGSESEAGAPDGKVVAGEEGRLAEDDSAVPEEGAPAGEGERIAGATEEEVFEAVGLPWIPPELRENRGEIEAAEEGRLPDLVTLDDIRGDLQMHSTWSDGKNSIVEMAEACRERGYEYLSITDHSQRVTVAGGMDEARAREQWKEIDAIRDVLEGIRLFRSMEVDILKDGSLDLDDEHLARLDVVLVSVHSYMDLSREEQTRRLVRAISHPLVHILAHPTGRRLNKRQPYEVDMETLLHAAREHRVAVELNASPERLDLSDVHVARARELGVPVVISTDAHRAETLAHMSYGVDQARRGWLGKKDVLNTRSLEELERWLEGKENDG